MKWELELEMEMELELNWSWRSKSCEGLTFIRKRCSGNVTCAIATRPEEQAVSMATQGPFRPNMYDMRPAADQSHHLSTTALYCAA